MTYTGQPPYLQTGADAAAENVTRLVNEILDLIGLRLPASDGQDPPMRSDAADQRVIEAIE